MDPEDQIRAGPISKDMERRTTSEDRNKKIDDFQIMDREFEKLSDRLTGSDDHVSGESLDLHEQENRVRDPEHIHTIDIDKGSCQLHSGYYPKSDIMHEKLDKTLSSMKKDEHLNMLNLDLKDEDEPTTSLLPQNNMFSGVLHSTQPYNQINSNSGDEDLNEVSTLSHSSYMVVSTPISSNHVVSQAIKAYLESELHDLGDKDETAPSVNYTFDSLNIKTWSQHLLNKFELSPDDNYSQKSNRAVAQVRADIFSIYVSKLKEKLVNYADLENYQIQSALSSMNYVEQAIRYTSNPHAVTINMPHIVGDVGELHNFVKMADKLHVKYFHKISSEINSQLKDKLSEHIQEVLYNSSAFSSSQYGFDFVFFVPNRLLYGEVLPLNTPEWSINIGESKLFDDVNSPSRSSRNGYSFMNEVDFITKTKPMDHRFNVAINKLDQVCGVVFNQAEGSDQNPTLQTSVPDIPETPKVNLNDLLGQFERQILKELRLTRLQSNVERSVFMSIVDHGENAREIGINRFEFKHLTYKQLDLLKEQLISNSHSASDSKNSNNQTSVHIFPDIIKRDQKGNIIGFDIEKENAFKTTRGDMKHQYLENKYGKIVTYREKGDDVRIPGIYQEITLKAFQQDPGNSDKSSLFFDPTNESSKHIGSASMHIMRIDATTTEWKDLVDNGWINLDEIDPNMVIIPSDVTNLTDIGRLLVSPNAKGIYHLTSTPVINLKTKDYNQALDRVVNLFSENHPSINPEAFFKYTMYLTTTPGSMGTPNMEDAYQPDNYAVSREDLGFSYGHTPHTFPVIENIRDSLKYQLSKQLDQYEEDTEFNKTESLTSHAIEMIDRAFGSRDITVHIKDFVVNHLENNRFTLDKGIRDMMLVSDKSGTRDDKHAFPNPSIFNDDGSIRGVVPPDGIYVSRTPRKVIVENEAGRVTQRFFIDKFGEYLYLKRYDHRVDGVWYEKIPITIDENKLNPEIFIQDKDVVAYVKEFNIQGLLGSKPTTYDDLTPEQQLELVSWSGKYQVGKEDRNIKQLYYHVFRNKLNEMIEDVGNLDNDKIRDWYEHRLKKSQSNLFSNIVQAAVYQQITYKLKSLINNESNDVKNQNVLNCERTISKRILDAFYSLYDTDLGGKLTTLSHLYLSVLGERINSVFFPSLTTDNAYFKNTVFRLISYVNRGEMHSRITSLMTDKNQKAELKFRDIINLNPNVDFKNRSLFDNIFQINSRSVKPIPSFHDWKNEQLKNLISLISPKNIPNFERIISEINQSWKKNRIIEIDGNIKPYKLNFNDISKEVNLNSILGSRSKGAKTPEERHKSWLEKMNNPLRNMLTSKLGLVRNSNSKNFLQLMEKILKG